MEGHITWTFQVFICLQLEGLQTQDPGALIGVKGEMIQLSLIVKEKRQLLQFQSGALRLEAFAFILNSLPFEFHAELNRLFFYSYVFFIFLLSVII